MVDVRANSVFYQSQTYFLELVDYLVEKKALGKALDPKWDKANRLLDYFEAYTERAKLDDIDDINYVIYCMIHLANLYQYPAAPTFNMATPPAIIVQTGPPGPKGDTGDRGGDGGGTDIQTTISTTGVVDHFPIENATGARWDYTVTRSTGQQRSGSVVGTWSTTGANIDMFDTATDDIVGTTEHLEFDVQFASGEIQLVAIITEGIWTIVLTRYFIPNNGAGTGPISDNLPFGLIYIGNSLNIATPRLVTGDITMTFDGTVTIGDGKIFNNHINTNAAIALTKLAALTANKVVITDGSGYLTTSDITPTELLNIQGGSSNFQDQIDLLMQDPMTSVGDIIIRNGLNVTTRLPIGTASQVLTVSGGIPQWADMAGQLPIVSVDIGDWDMDTTAQVSVTVPGVVASKIRAIHGVIRTDVGSVLGETYYPVAAYGENSAAGKEPNIHISGWIPDGGDTTVFVRRVDSSVFDTNSFDATSYNRGWLVITYVP